ncbi:MAG: class I SAM-dependent methyltransferase [Myxococcales bacterium]|nr:class I SAM-dependent methyltransferase [Deltaproteobacteria bacterium]NND29445.1 class I SAM-dependent methyltransferase [Myxococcales bacterium]MBT8480614.1 class I SAM-dependent methyltransferase [Deltaproteobacteria bacterium]NNK08940.1 class I SAM-dependent methyltransferase [Myxococcales bacterium]NNK41269.1 class I SAM-dependent methyltransferase [Myxococcales bacterium]
MSGEPADEADVVSSRAPRKRRALRVPITEIPRATVRDYTPRSETHGNGASSSASNVLELDPPSGVTFAVEPSDDREPTEPSFMTIPDPLFERERPPDDGELSAPSIDVHFSEPPKIRASTMPPSAARYSDPPEELFLDDADVLSRSDIAPPLDSGPDILIPIPKPPPPPAGSMESVPPEVESDEAGPWHEHFFGEAYLRTVRTSTPKEVAVECGFIERAMRVPVGSRILDVGCGLGVQTVELASRGYHMVGLDISSTMISRAYDEAEDRGLQIDFVRGDMRDVTFEAPFDAMLCWGTTFGYFSEEENEGAIRMFHRAIRPHGTLLLEVVNRDFMIGSQPNQVWFEVDGAVCMEETDFDYATSRLRVKRRVANQSGQQHDRLYSIRLYALHEICALLEQNGFRVDEISGREATLGIFFGVHSPKMIIRAERMPGSLPRASSVPPVRPSAAPSTPPSVRPPVPLGALRPSEFPPDSSDTADTADTSEED